MDQKRYHPDIYDGDSPYIHISYHPNDREQVLRYLEKLDLRGFRFWSNDGLVPGMDTDELIAEHIEKCSFFIAFLSSSYLGSLDMVDELNFSRDSGKEYLLVYLENVTLPAGLDMRFMRSESVRAYQNSESEVVEQLIHIRGADRFFGILDPKLRARAEPIIAKLEQLYPEHKIFSLDAIDKNLAREILSLYLEAEFPNVQRLLLDYGYLQISTDEARSLRSSVIYQPGFEPDVIRPRVDYIMTTLTEDYPGKVITDRLSESHHSLYSSLRGISIWLGYASAADMLKAYGFIGMISSKAGRSETDFKDVLEQLQKRYADSKKPSSIREIIKENPDLSGPIKTLSNRAFEIWGMSLVSYFKEVGIVAPIGKAEKTSVEAQKRGGIIEEIRSIYSQADASWGNFSDIEETLSQIRLKKNVRGKVIVPGCSACSETMHLPQGINIIQRDAFSGQTDLVQLILPASLEEIQEGAFSDCASLTKITIPEGLKRIHSRAFAGCSNLEELTLPASLVSIGNEAFADCSALSKVVFQNPRINIQQDAFDGCPYQLEDLQNSGASRAEFFELKIDRKNRAKITAYTGHEEIVVIPEMIAGHPIDALEKGCFKDNLSVREIYIHDHIREIKGDAFKGCGNLKKAHISEAVSKFTGSVFAGCFSLEEVNIPDAMEVVPKGLFKDCPLITVYIGKNTREISSDSFYKGDIDITTGLYFKKQGLQNLFVDSSNPYLTAAGTMLLSRDNTVLIADLGDPQELSIPDGIQEIMPRAYEKQGTLCTVQLPDTLKKIGERAFAGTEIKSVEIPESVQEIGERAFSYCRSLSRLELYDGLKTIAPQAFEGCPIADVYIPATVELLGADSFLAISSYHGQISQKFRIDSANPFFFVDGVALYQKTDTECILIKAYYDPLRTLPGSTSQEQFSYEIEEGTTAIAANAFAHCNNLSSVILPAGLQSIGDKAFWDCNALTELQIPESCTEISPNAFFGTEIKIN